jgi:DUF3093 family protein
MYAYEERLSVPVTWWLLAGLLVALLGAELWAGLGVIAAVVTYVVLAGCCGAILLRWGSLRLRVTCDELAAGQARLPLKVTGEVTALDERQTRAIRGQHADPAAHLVIRPYLKRAVYVEVTDPGRPTPYWLVGTRHPAELAAALSVARTRAAPHRGNTTH